MTVIDGNPAEMESYSCNGCSVMFTDLSRFSALHYFEQAKEVLSTLDQKLINEEEVLGEEITTETVVIISKKDWKAITSGNPPESIRIFKETDLHYEFGDEHWEDAVKVRIEKEKSGY